MKVRCKVQPFRDSFQLVSAVANQRSPKPILANVKMIATDEGVELIATDLEVAIRCPVEGVEVAEPGEALLNAATIGNILRECDDETINIDTKDFVTKISYTNAEYTLQSSDPDEFPVIATYEAEGAVDLNAADLREMIRCTSFAASRDTTSFALNGLFFVLKPGEIRMVGADRHRLAYMRKKTSTGEGVEAAVIVPTKAMERLEKMMTDDEETIGVKILEKQILLRGKRGLIAAQLVEGKYPDYETVVPKGCSNKFEIDCQVLLHSVRKATPVAPDESKSVKMKLRKGKMIVTSLANEKGSAEIEVAIDYDGDDIDMSFNPDYLTDMLRVMGEKTVKAELKDGESPGLLRIGKDFKYVIMPMQLDDEA